MQMRMLRALQHQKALRQAIEKEQEDVMRLSERAYRKFTRSTFRQRVEIFKQVRLGLVLPTPSLPTMHHPR